jgi:hypothetical protein
LILNLFCFKEEGKAKVEAVAETEPVSGDSEKKKKKHKKDEQDGN